MSISDVELITGYRDIVFDIYGMRQRLEWNQRHGLPSLKLPEKINRLRQELLRFEDLMETISDRRTRNVICMRYVLGYSDRDTADYMNLSRVTVSRICNDTLRKLSRRMPS